MIQNVSLNYLERKKLSVTKLQLSLCYQADTGELLQFSRFQLS